MHALKDIAPYLAIAACALALAAAVLLALLWRGVRKLRRAQTVVMGRREERDLIAHAEHLDGRVQNLREAVEILTDKLTEHKAHLDEALTNRAVVRYDAFRDAGGEQSSSLALLDNYRSGFVISTISARDFARLYVKTIDHGTPDRELSPEEEQAVRAAVPRPLSLPGMPAAAPAPPATSPGAPAAAPPAPTSRRPTGAREPTAPAAAAEAEPSPVAPSPSTEPGPETARQPETPATGEDTLGSWFDVDDTRTYERPDEAPPSDRPSPDTAPPNVDTASPSPDTAPGPPAEAGHDPGAGYQDTSP